MAVTQRDGTPLPFDRQRNAFVRFRIETNGAGTLPQEFKPVGPESIVAISFTPDPLTEYITVTASFVERDIEDPTTVVVERAIAYRSPSNSYIYVTSSTMYPQVGDYMIFTVKVC